MSDCTITAKGVGYSVIQLSDILYHRNHDTDTREKHPYVILKNRHGKTCLATEKDIITMLEAEIQAIKIRIANRALSEMD